MHGLVRSKVLGTLDIVANVITGDPADLIRWATNQFPFGQRGLWQHIDDRSDSRVWPLHTAIMWQPVILSLFIQRTILKCYSSGEPAKDLISLLMLCATLNDSATAEVSSSPSPQVAVIIAR
jgi:hypothetical protein